MHLMFIKPGYAGSLLTIYIFAALQLKSNSELVNYSRVPQIVFTLS